MLKNGGPTGTSTFTTTSTTNTNFSLPTTVIGVYTLSLNEKYVIRKPNFIEVTSHTYTTKRCFERFKWFELLPRKVLQTKLLQIKVLQTKVKVVGLNGVKLVSTKMKKQTSSLRTMD